ncbi:MAG: ATP-dependent Clp protease adaptor ClpS [Planctomycetota bacterium]|jgi:ATP-dependent Clp protease adaptor protein ClpS
MSLYLHFNHEEAAPVPEPEHGAEDMSREAASEGSAAALAVAPAKKQAKTKKKPKKLPPYKVLLHNDDVNSFDHVILAILKLTKLLFEDAVIKTLEAHDTGVSLLLVTHKERAELYAEQFATFKLTVTIEPDGE